MPQTKFRSFVFFVAMAVLMVYFMIPYSLTLERGRRFRPVLSYAFSFGHFPDCLQ